MRLAQPFPSTEPCIRTADNDGPATTNGDRNHPGRERRIRPIVLHGCRLVAATASYGAYPDDLLAAIHGCEQKHGHAGGGACCGALPVQVTDSGERCGCSRLAEPIDGRSSRRARGPIRRTSPSRYAARTRPPPPPGAPTTPPHPPPPPPPSRPSPRHPPPLRPPPPL